MLEICARFPVYGLGFATEIGSLRPGRSVWSIALAKRDYAGFCQPGQFPADCFEGNAQVVPMSVRDWVA